MTPHTYIVTIPIAGHLRVEVIADSVEEAEKLAWDNPEDGEPSWEMLSKFGQGNVCHCPMPWQVEIEDCGEDES